MRLTVLLFLFFSAHFGFAQAQIAPGSGNKQTMRIEPSQNTQKSWQNNREETQADKDRLSFSKNNVSFDCSVKNLFAKHRFSKALEASDRVNMPSVPMAATLFSVNLPEIMEKFILKELAEINDSRALNDAYSFPEPDIKFNFDANCTRGTRTEIRVANPKTANISEKAGKDKLIFKSVIDINFENLNVQPGDKKFGMGEFSNFCFSFGTISDLNESCNPEKIKMYCQADDCYVDSLENLVKSTKITSQKQPEPLKSLIREIEAKN
jgi:hypothetical protein